MKKINRLLLRLAFGLTCVALVAGCGKARAQNTSTNSAPAARAKLKQLGKDYSPIAFFQAVDNGNLELVALFLDAGMSGSTRVEEAKGNYDALYFACLACTNQQAEVVSLLLSRGADPNTYYGRVGTLLDAAAGFGNTAIMKLLISNGAKVDCRNKEYELTPLMGASVKGRKAAVALLIEKGANVNAADNAGITSLMQACAGVAPQVVEELIRAGASVNATDKSGMTALMYAAFKGDAESAQVLLKNGAKRDIKNASGKTALDYALQEKKDEVAMVLQQSDVTAPAQASSGESQKLSANQIEGAFGLKFGDTFDTTKGVFVEPTVWGEFPVPVDEHYVVYKFTPQKPLPPFESYYIKITPKTHKICSIFAVARENLPDEKKEQLDVVVAALSNKYGKKSESGWGFILYSIGLDGKSICLQRSGVQLNERVQTTYVVTLGYGDDTLEDLEKRERTELSKAKQDSEQRELEKKAKGLEKSGL